MDETCCKTEEVWHHITGVAKLRVSLLMMNLIRHLGHYAIQEFYGFYLKAGCLSKIMSLLPSQAHGIRWEGSE